MGERVLGVRAVRCPRCGRVEELGGGLLAEAARRAGRTGVYALAFRHVGHVLLVFVDRNGDVRGVEVGDVAEREEPLFAVFDLLPVPAPLGEAPPLRRLSRVELAVLSMCDGETTVREIADKLYMPYGQVKAVVEKLLAEGYLRDLYEVVR